LIQIRVSVFYLEIMAFVCTITEESFHADVFRRGGEYIVHVHVGYDDQSDKNYSIVVGLSPAPPGEYEYYFAFVEVNGEDDSEREIWDGRETGAIINREHKREIMAVIMAATKGLLEHAKPGRFFMATHGDHLPDKAMAKYRALHTVFEDCGYTVNQTDSYHGRRAWWMER